MKKILLTFIIAAVASAYSFSQNKAINGSVYAFKDLHLININVEAKKSGAVVRTDSLGRFTIVCDKKDKLTFSGHGFQTVVKKVNKKDSLRIKMVFIEGKKNEEIAVGYGHISQELLTYAIANFSQHNNDFSNYSDIYALIQGRVPGVEVTLTNNGKEVIIRGKSSISSNCALYIVDGSVVPDISYINPGDVVSIDVIKDGNAMYGARGANGVVIITTFR